MTGEQAFFIFATTVNFLTAFWILAALFTDRLQRLPRWHLMGLAVGCLGLLFQAMRNLQFLMTGVSPEDADLPIWFLKDMGYALIAFHSVWLILAGKLKLNDQANTPAPAPKPTRAAKPAPKRAPAPATVPVSRAVRAAPKRKAPTKAPTAKQAANKQEQTYGL
jgi:hypothetical protein